jgi:putative ABC transport system substrate-binding protein
MKRRVLLSTIGTGLLYSSSALRAQHSRRMPHLGILLFSTPKGDPQMEALRAGLRELGYSEGHNMVLEYRYAEGKPERLAELAADLVHSKPDVLVCLGGDVTSAGINATRTIPIVFASSADPVQLRFVESLARPGRNATGITLLLDELATKRLELFKQAAPAISRVAFIFNPDHADNELRRAEEATRTLGIELHPLEVRGSGDFDRAFETSGRTRVDAVYVVSSRLTVRHIDRLVGYAAANRLPLAGGWGAWAQQGALLSYGPNIDDMVRRAAGYVDKILRGAKPNDLPVQQPTTFELVLNSKTAKTLDLKIPPGLLARADAVIE